MSPATMGPSEIAAGVLRDLKRAKIVGTATTGLTAGRNCSPSKRATGFF
ncbi:MAG: S41 family peptidase [Candidatus Moduliflexus flocculans]|nr:S41 family peptidase [Candidatus Moduliflexus flocculans]